MMKHDRPSTHETKFDAVFPTPGREASPKAGVVDDSNTLWA